MRIIKDQFDYMQGVSVLHEINIFKLVLLQGMKKKYSFNDETKTHYLKCFKEIRDDNPMLVDFLDDEKIFIHEDRLSINGVDFTENVWCVYGILDVVSQLLDLLSSEMAEYSHEKNKGKNRQQFEELAGL